LSAFVDRFSLKNILLILGKIGQTLAVSLPSACHLNLRVACGGWYASMSAWALRPDELAHMEKFKITSSCLVSPRPTASCAYAWGVKQDGGV